MVNPTKMEREARGGRLSRWFDRRVQQKGLRPRFAAYAVVGFWVAAVIVFGVVERLVDPKTFDNVWLAMWWALQTVTTVGYGDVVPAQTVGKILAAFLMFGGLSLLAVVTAAITSGFVTRQQDVRRAAGEDPVMQKLEQMTVQFEAIRADLDRLQRKEQSR